MALRQRLGLPVLLFLAAGACGRQRSDTTNVALVQAPPVVPLDSLDGTVETAPSHSAAEMALKRALFATQASNQLADTLVTLASTAKNHRIVVFASLALIPYHDARTAAPLIRRALLPQTVPV